MQKIRYPFQPDYVDALPEPVVEPIRELDIKLLEMICSRLRVSDQLNEVTVDAIRALRSHGIPLEQIKKAIRDTENLTQKKLDALLDDVVARNEKYYGKLCTLADVTRPQAMVDARDIDAIRQQCQREFANITRSMGFLVNAGRTLLPPAQAYTHCLDSALLQVESGAVSYNKAIADAVQELAKSGLCVFTDAKGEHRNMVLYERKPGMKRGHVDHLDVAVRRAVLTATNQLNQKYREQSMDYLKTDLVEVTAHIGARNKGDGFVNHESWQGKIYRWNREK